MICFRLALPSESIFSKEECEKVYFSPRYWNLPVLMKCWNISGVPVTETKNGLVLGLVLSNTRLRVVLWSGYAINLIWGEKRCVSDTFDINVFVL